MPFHQPEQIRFYTSELLDCAGVLHAVFSRQGGVSPAPWATLNMGATVGDDPDCVAENRRLAFQSVGRSIDSMYDVWQVHSADVVVTKAPRPPKQAHQKADAILTNQPGVTLFMRFADCVPILLYDPQNQVIGIVHAGWLGTVRKIVGVTIQTMADVYSSLPQDILAFIGPSIGPHHYEIGIEVIDRVRTAFGQEADGLLLSQNGAVQFDLWTANQVILENSGVRQIEGSKLCTACHLDDWYSHRGERGRTGRFGALIAL